MREFYSCLLEGLKEGRGGATAIVVASDSPGLLYRRVYCDAEGRLRWPDQPTYEEQELARWLTSRRPQAPGLEQVEGLGLVYAEPVEPHPEVLILGGGHVGLALARILAVLRYPTTVVDDRPEFATAERFPGCRVICGGFEEVLADYPLHQRSFVVIVTRGHRHDYACLRAVVSRPVAYLGMIGSHPKVEAIFESLRREGIAEEELARVCAPIGLDIGARTPEEIAVSIAAQIIAVNSRFQGERLDAGWLEKVVASPSPAAVVTVVQAEGSTPRGAGARMLVLGDGQAAGTIGGGTAEARALREALEIAGGSSSRLLEFDLTGEQAEREGMICGGRMRVFVEPLT
ncbi:MAG: XdhC family protein [Clostridia bacterium]|jgi:xanthine dehydrogenase accessory factor|nr:XdhC family protein [Clostridia bacterium]MDH7572956.1 XdhC family protein [Clostridia bacterium]